MIPKECKRLIEVDFPIATVSAHAAREKSIRHGHPSTLHLWWARRPLAACRAVLLGLLLPDPCDPLCPSGFKPKARELLSNVQGKPNGSDESLRKALLKFIGDFANWNLSNNISYLEVARELVKAAHPEETPLVVDPFAGGGSIPLEALRLGCEAFASDLNPVSCLILKVLLEDIPRYGVRLADELRKVGEQIKAEVEKELAEFYPVDPDGSRPIAYLWARTVRCEAPNCGAEIPLVRSFWLSKKAKRKRALRYKVIRPKGEPPFVEFEIFEPASERDVPAGTVSRAKARCLACGAVLSPERVRAQLSLQKGGADVVFDKKGNRIGGAYMLAVVTLKDNEQGRYYRLPTERDYKGVFKAMQALEQKIVQPLPNGLSPVPDEPLPPIGTLGFRVQRYGMLQWGDLFTARQKLALMTLTNYVCAAGNSDIISLLVLCLGKSADGNNTAARWMPGYENPANLFARQAIPMVWDFSEATPTSEARGVFLSGIDTTATLTESLPVNNCGQVQLADACVSPLPDSSCSVWFTDPPYYDAVPYADLSDFFYVWLKRTLPNHSLPRDPFDPQNPLTPKFQELVLNERSKTTTGQPKDQQFYEKGMTQAFSEGSRVLRDDGIGCVVFAHKTTEGWEALLSGMLKAGWTITASWPIATEMGTRLRARESAALATSVHLVCRPRPKNAGVGDWVEVKVEMERRVREWMSRLLEEGIRGADAIFSCIGPALEVYSRYKKVETPAGHIVPLGGNPEAIEPHERGFLSYVFEAVSREALRQVLGDAETEGFEEDARLTALFLWALQTTRMNNTQAAEKIEETEEIEEEDEEEEERPKKTKGGLAMPFDTFIRITRPMGIHYPNWLRRIIEIEKGVVRLIPVAERRESLIGEEALSLPVEFRAESPQLNLFNKDEPVREKRTIHKTSTKQLDNFTTLDRLHRAMLLFGAGQTTLLRRVLDEERQIGKRFERLALALTALYPEKSQERRWLEGVQTMIKR